MLPGPRVFRNRWFALLWAGGMVWLAYDVASATAPAAPPESNTAAPSETNAADADAADTDALGQPVTNDDLNALANAMSG